MGIFDVFSSALTDAVGDKVDEATDRAADAAANRVADHVGEKVGDAVNSGTDQAIDKVASLLQARFAPPATTAAMTVPAPGGQTAGDNEGEVAALVTT